MLVYQSVNEWTGGVLETRGLRFRRVAGRRMLIFLFRTNLCWGAGVLNLPWLIILPYFSTSISFQSIHTRIAVQSFQPFIFQQKKTCKKRWWEILFMELWQLDVWHISCNYWSNRWFWVIYWVEFWWDLLAFVWSLMSMRSQPWVLVCTQDEWTMR